jgi:glycosyltransferase involved in cell wall biosynthesis
MTDGADSRKPRVLLLFSKFGKGPSDRYLSNELADALAEAGFAVDVVVIPWDAPPGPARQYVQANGVSVLLSPPAYIGSLGKAVRLASKWALSSFVASRRAAAFLRGKRFDLVFAMSPLVVVAALILDQARRSGTRLYAYLVDFFPHHHGSLGLIPGPLLGPAAWFENALLRRFDTVACMSPKGIDYLRRKYRISPRQTVEQLSLWTSELPIAPGDRSAIRERFGLSPQRQIAIFGGQIAKGRGIEEIIEASKLASASHPDLLFLFVGGGPLEDLVRTAQTCAENVILIPGMARDLYLELASACDVGIVCTVADVDVPTFPSKTLDYLRAGLPIVASVEATTDFGALVNQEGFGLATEAGSPDRLLELVTRVTGDSRLAQDLVQAGQAALATTFSVDLTIAQITRSMAADPQKPGPCREGQVT